MIGVMSAECLTFHAAWACRHSGACCRAGWAIPVEAPVFERLRIHFGESAVHEAVATGGPSPEGAAGWLKTRGDGACAFHERSRCAIHRQLGLESLPLACRQFPRVVLRDARGTFVRLSCYCPTAAALLVADPSIGIVCAGPLLGLSGELEGLDARGVLPPLLKQDLLTDVEGYAAWESRGVATLASAPTVQAALACLAGATDRLFQWRPGAQSLADAVADAFAMPAADAMTDEPHESIRRYCTAVAAVPPGLSAAPLPARIEDHWQAVRDLMVRHDAALRAYAASHLFGNWIAYSASHLATVVEYLRTCISVVAVELARGLQMPQEDSGAARLTEALRGADLLLVHLADMPALARQIEHHADFRSRTLSSLRRHRHAVG